MLFVGDIVLVGKSSEKVNDKLEGKGLRIIRSKIEYVEFDFGGRVHGANKERQAMKMSGDVVCKVERFKYLGSVLQRNGCFEENVNYMVKCEWMKWREVSGVLCGKEILIRVKI